MAKKGNDDASYSDKKDNDASYRAKKAFICTTIAAETSGPYKPYNYDINFVLQLNAELASLRDTLDILTCQLVQMCFTTDSMSRKTKSHATKIGCVNREIDTVVAILHYVVGRNDIRTTHSLHF